MCVCVYFNEFNLYVCLIFLLIYCVLLFHVMCILYVDIFSLYVATGILSERERISLSVRISRHFQYSNDTQIQFYSRHKTECGIIFSYKCRIITIFILYVCLYACLLACARNTWQNIFFCLQRKYKKQRCRRLVDKKKYF